MRFLHLSDLHIGKRLGELSLADDQSYVFRQILALCADVCPDAVVIAGDLYDKSVPSPDAVLLADDFLTALTDIAAQVIAVAGNHDSPERLAFGRRLMGKLSIAPVYNGHVEPVLLCDAYGETAFYPLPFIKPAHVRAAFPDEPVETYTDAVRTALSHIPLNRARRNVLITHQFVAGASRCDSETVGGGDGVDSALFDPFDYVALGHLHSPQHVARETVRYCGSPLKYSFSEAEQQKSVTLVELSEPGAVEIHTLPLTPLHELRRLRGSYDELTLKANYQGTRTEDYLTITLTDEEEIPEAVGKLSAVYPNLIRLDYDNRRTRASHDIDRIAPDLKARDPLSLFAELYEKQNDAPMTDAQRAYLRDRIAALWEEENRASD